MHLQRESASALSELVSPTCEPGGMRIAQSIAMYPRWVSLFFARGVGLPDPHKRLSGSGNVVRHIVLTEIAVLDDPQIRELVQQALARSGASLQAGKRGAIVIKSISARQRPRRPAAKAIKKKSL